MSRNKFFKRARGYAGTIIDAFLPDLKNERTGIYSYGTDNLLPNNLLKFIASSGVATRAANKLSEYITSDGFTDTAAAAIKVNEYQTADQLLKEQSVYMAMLEVCAFHISRNAQGKVALVKALPPQCLRKKIGGGYLYNETFGQEKYDKTKDIDYAEYISRDLSPTEINSGAYKNGEVLYVYIKSPFSSYYPVPTYYSQIEDVRTSSEISKMDLELTLNGFMPSALITLVGQYDDTTKDDLGETEVDQLIDEFKKFTGQIKRKADDLSGRFKGWLTFARTKEEVPVIQTLDIKAILDSSNEKRDIIDRAVCRLFSVHPVLLGYSDSAILGNTQAIANASLELTRSANNYQRRITEAFKMLYPVNDWTISEYMPINYVPDALLQDMTQDERRNRFLGLPPLAMPATPTTPPAP